MSGIKDSFLDLQRHRLQLEGEVQKLQKGLQHWQAWDAEYEALKEEIDSLSKTDSECLAHVKEIFEGELLDKKEIEEIFGGKAPKSKDQIKNVLDRRIDYVTQNIKTLEKQLETAENKLAAVTVISQPDATDEDGQPITEIIEELDDEDNVINYRLNKPGDSLPHVQEALGKVGIEDITAPADTKPSPSVPKTQVQNAPKEEAAKKDINQKALIAQEGATSTSPARKGVTFDSSTKSEDGPTPQVSRNAKRVEEIMKTAKEQEDQGKVEPVIPEDEDEDDAEMRRQMLAYGMGEVGAVVAELELMEGDTDEDDYEFDYSDEGFDEDEDEDGDLYTRDKKSVITDGYRKRMLELEKKLGVKSRFTAAEETKATARKGDDDDGESSSDDERIGRIVVKQNSGTPSSIPSSSKPAPTKSNIREKEPTDAGGKKGVRFAPSLDIAPDDAPVAEPVKEVIEKEEPLIEPLSDIVERTVPAKPVEAKTDRKPSRFKKSRGNATSSQGVPPGPLDMPTRFLDQDRPTAPTGPEGATIADTLVERETTADSQRPGEFEDDMMYGQVADEYHRLRRKFIHREGGFLKEDESPIQPLDDAVEGKEPVSRFKAAKLSRQ